MQYIKKGTAVLSMHLPTWYHSHPLIFLGILWTLVILMMIGWMEQLPRVQLRHYTCPLRKQLEASEGEVSESPDGKDVVTRLKQKNQLH